MSLHLKVGAQPMAKRGSIGEMHYQTIRDDVVTESEIRSTSPTSRTAPAPAPRASSNSTSPE